MIIDSNPRSFSSAREKGAIDYAARHQCANHHNWVCNRHANTPPFRAPARRCEMKRVMGMHGGRHECGVCNGGGTDEGECRCPRMIEWGMRNVKCGVMIRWM
ncbi:hypothetical protein DEO72_LG11g2911 [Vigna unguiculata]|uniref:Uncharacterized protein n=1 Tax=Vigna unguiculata TaxID=3917 RepID=A0A4D6NTQ5_VIGUN|nr:hypothetical protein DEO72_LG11g2911 [Vigna unguiculata]